MQTAKTIMKSVRPLPIEVANSMPNHKKVASATHRSRPKRSALKPIVLESVFLELKSTALPMWDHPEPDNYITPLSGDVCIPFDEDDSKTVGSISAYLVHLGNAAEDQVSCFEVLDAHSADTALYLDLFETEGSSFKDSVQSIFEPYSHDLLILDRIRIEPEFRGKGYGLYAAKLMVDHFGPSGGLVACVPAPYELLQKYELLSVQDGFRLSRDERLPEWGPAETKLRAFWSLLGFQQVATSDVFALSLTFQQPAIQDVLRIYFERKIAVTSLIQ